MDLTDLGFDFEEMARLAQTDPDAFARRREELIEQSIERANCPEGLAEMQMDIDSVRYRTSPGLPAGTQLTDLLLESVRRMSSHMARLNDLVDGAVSKGEPQTGNFE
jgi:hypothetical protein